MTRYAVCSDVHEDFEAFAKFLATARANGTDHIIVAGDLGRLHESKKSLDQLLQDGDVERFEKDSRAHHKGVQQRFKDMLDRSRIAYSVIGGNYDGPLGPVFGGKDIHMKTTRVNRAVLSGYGGADAYPPHIQRHVALKNIIKFDHEQMYKHLTKTHPDIAVAHNPARGFRDKMFNGNHVGSEGALAYLQQAFAEGKAPKAYINGHIHEARGVEKIEANGQRTVVVNCGNLGRDDLPDFRTLRPAMIAETYGTFAIIDTEADGKVNTVLECTINDGTPQRRIGNPYIVQRHDFN